MTPICITHTKIFLDMPSALIMYHKAVDLPGRELYTIYHTTRVYEKTCIQCLL